MNGSTARANVMPLDTRITDCCSGVKPSPSNQ